MQLAVFTTCATEGGSLSRAPQFLELLNDVFCCTARLANDPQTIIAGISHQKMGAPLRVSTILHLRDHFYAQEQMFRRRAAKVALCFGVRIHSVMASPSVMLKVFFLLEVTNRTEGTGLRAVGVESVVVLEMDGRAWETRCLPLRISTRRRCIICHDTTPHDRGQQAAHKNAACCTPLHSQDTHDSWTHSHS